MINCFDTTPIAALSFQWFASAPHMTNMKWAPLVGATIITTKAWKKIPEISKPAVLKAAAAAGVGFREDIRKNSDKAVDVMKRNGLKVHDITKEQYTQWEDLFKSVYPQISNTIVPPDIMQMAINYRNEYRVQAAKKK
jgi:TRAP-type C4-dicarboxylate transport system substrate-binding protein